ncbi:MAG: RNA polymerase sigma-54 factor, partial [Candidatus Electrothrix sp. AS4_5]|nr:RNA polymerase sigma-54 factor [Candidatus Electrothrix gigas]
MKPSLQLRVSQQLTLTPQLQQAIRLLQLSTIEMQQEVSEMLNENPMLEQSEDNPTESFEAAPPTEPAAEPNFDKDEFSGRLSDWGGEGTGKSPYSDDEEEPTMEQAADPESLREHLHATLNISTLDELDREVVAVLIDALDDNGYLAYELEELLEMLPEGDEHSLDDLETGLKQLQYLDIPGIGARNLSECLALQLKALPPETPQRELALKLVTKYIELVAAHDFTKIKRRLHCTNEELKEAQHLISALNPRPGAIFSATTADYVIPDVIVEKRDGEWQARLNPDAMPKLRVNQVYANILKQRSDGNASQLSTQLQEARWMIKNLQQRFDTILRVAEAIVQRQAMFLEHGEIQMRPLVLREIAEALEMHESTISRGTTQKFMHTPRGIYEFKYFFGSSLSTNSGGSLSSTAIREHIKQMV